MIFTVRPTNSVTRDAMRRSFPAILCLIVAATISQAADVMKEKWPERVAVIPTQKSFQTSAKDFTISITTPESAEIRAGGGSGGPMMKFTVIRASDAKKIEFYNQTVCTVLLTSWGGFPQLEIWGRGGGGYWTRGLYRFIDGTYKAVRYDEFEMWPRHGNEKSATLDPPFDHGVEEGKKWILYFVESRRAES